MNSGISQAGRSHGEDPSGIDQILSLARKRFSAVTSASLPNGDLVFGNEHISVESLQRTAHQCTSDVNATTRFELVALSMLTESARRQKNGSVSGSTPDLFSVFQRLFPILLPQAKQPVREVKGKTPVFQNWLGNVAIGYAIEHVQSYQVVNQRWLESWGISIEELHAIAVNNLEETILGTTLHQDDLGNLSLSEVRTFRSELGITVLAPGRVSVYNASHILSPIFRKSLSDVLGNEWLVAFPARDLWVAASKNVVNDKKGLAQFERSVAHYFDHWPQPIDQQLYQVSNDGVSIWNDRDDFSPAKAA